MTHGITEDDNVLTGFGLSQWHKLGTVFEGELTLEQIVEEFGWEVEKRPLYTNGAKLADANAFDDMLFAKLEIPDRYALVRVDTDTVMAPAVSDRYEIFQNHQGFEMIQAIAGLGVPFISAGTLFGGRKVFGCLRLPDDIKVGGVHVVPYFIGTWGHDAATGIGFLTGPIAPVCDNTLQFTMAHAKTRWSTSHAGDATKRVAEAREAVGLAEVYYAQYAQMIERAINTPVSLGTMAATMRSVFPIDEVKMTTAQITAVQGTRTKVWSIYNRDDRFADFHGTAWGGMQAFNTWDQWGRTLRGSGAQGRALQQATRALNGQTEAFNTKVMAGLGVS